MSEPSTEIDHSALTKIARMFEMASYHAECLHPVHEHGRMDR